MKKSIRKTMALGMAGILLLSGCGGKADTAADAEWVQEESAEAVKEQDGTAAGEGAAYCGAECEMTDVSDNGGAEAPEDFSGAAESDAYTDATESTAAEDADLLQDATAGGSKSEAMKSAENFAKKTPMYDTEMNLQDSYAESESFAGERKLAGTPTEDLYAKQDAPDGYLGSCYEFGDEIGVHEGGEEYSKWEEQGFFSVMAQPLSTFSADVDTASYSNLRRLICEGYDLDSLPEGAVRIEEMLNYFSYDYKEPTGQEPFGVTTQIGRCPWNSEAELLMIGLKTEDIDYSYASASNLVFLLDVSGSMGDPDKLPLLQESFSQLTDNLTQKDRVSIVTYASEDTIVLRGTPGSEKRKIKGALNSLKAGGGTWGSRGIETAYALAEENFIKGGNNRVILATDGDLNIGMTTEEELEELISEKKESGIFLSVLGFGTGNIKDNKMETLADKGNGNYAYIDCLREAKKVLSEEMTATLLTVCKDVKFQVEFNPDVVEGYRLLGYENRALDRQDFDDDKKDGGEIGAGHSVTALYEIVLREPMDHNLTKGEINDLRYGSEYEKRQAETGRTYDANASKEWLTISIRYKKPAGTVSQLLEYPIGYECYRHNPTEDFLFAAAVAEFGLLASHSAYPEGADVRHVSNTLRELDLRDEYRAEFLELVQETDWRR